MTEADPNPQPSRREKWLVGFGSMFVTTTLLGIYWLGIILGHVQIKPGASNQARWALATSIGILLLHQLYLILAAFILPRRLAALAFAVYSTKFIYVVLGIAVILLGLAYFVL